MSTTTAAADLRQLALAGLIDWSLPIDEALATQGDPFVLAARQTDWFGAFEPWLVQRGVTDIFVNGAQRPVVIVEKGARLTTETRLHHEWIVQAAAALVVRSGVVNDGCLRLGTVDRWLRFATTDGAASPDGPTIALRILPQRWRTLAELVRADLIGSAAAELLVEALRRGATVLVAGGTGSGKTTLAAALLQALGAERRVVVIEEACELPVLPDSVAIEVAAAGQSFAACVRFALRQRPDVIVVGEVRGGEALALLQAAATGHAGLGTIHAPDPQGALRNLERMACATGEAPPGVVRALIAAGSVPLLVAQIGSVDGRRRLVSIDEVLPQGGGGQSGDRYPTHSLFAWDSATRAIQRTGWAQGSWGGGVC